MEGPCVHGIVVRDVGTHSSAREENLPIGGLPGECLVLPTLRRGDVATLHLSTTEVITIIMPITRTRHYEWERAHHAAFWVIAAVEVRVDLHCRRSPWKTEGEHSPVRAGQDLVMRCE